MILVDSSVGIDYFNGIATPETDCLDRILEDQLILLGDIMLAEVLQGFRKDEDFETARQALASLQTVEMLNPGLAVQSVRNYRSLRQAEITVHKTIDCLVATDCIENGVTLLHSDHDFEPFEALLGLSVVHCES